MLTVLEIIKKTTEFFGGKGLENPRLNAELIIGHALGLKRMQLYVQFERMLPEADLEKIRPLVRRRAMREPLQYVLGETEWCGLKLKVDWRALIPRPETELLVEMLVEKFAARSAATANATAEIFIEGRARTPLRAVGPGEVEAAGSGVPALPLPADAGAADVPVAESRSDFVSQSPSGSTKVEPYAASAVMSTDGSPTSGGPTPKIRRVLDLGTGTGAIALALAQAWPEATVTGVDRSAEALALARENATATGLAERVRWVESDWFSALGDEMFDVIVSNPPYLTAQEVAEAEPEVKNFEPMSALAADDAGMKDLKTIIAGAAQRLGAGGWLALETGIAQHAELMRVCAKHGFGEVESRKDLTGRDRFILARKA